MNKTMTLAALLAAFAISISACEPHDSTDPTPDGPDVEQNDTTDVKDEVVEVPDDNSAFEGLTHKAMKESDAKIANPERGFYFVESMHSAEEKVDYDTIIKGYKILKNTFIEFNQ